MTSSISRPPPRTPGGVVDPARPDPAAIARAAADGEALLAALRDLGELR